MIPASHRPRTHRRSLPCLHSWSGAGPATTQAAADLRATTEHDRGASRACGSLDCPFAPRVLGRWQSCLGHALCRCQLALVKRPFDQPHPYPTDRHAMRGPVRFFLPLRPPVSQPDPGGERVGGHDRPSVSTPPTPKVATTFARSHGRDDANDAVAIVAAWPARCTKPSALTSSSAYPRQR
jgi:hypothetical protein